MMKKTTYKWLLALAVLVLAFVGSTTSSSAKTKWTKGTPSALRGTWVDRSEGHQIDPISEIDLGYPAEKITKTVVNETTERDPEGSTTDPFKPVYYHHKKGSEFYYLKMADTQLYDDYSHKNTWTYKVFHIVGNKQHSRQYGEKNDDYNKPYKAVHEKYYHWYYRE